MEPRSVPKVREKKSGGKKSQKHQHPGLREIPRTKSSVSIWKTKSEQRFRIARLEI